MRSEAEICVCDGCGYEYSMPKLELFAKDNLGTFDIASWGYCMPKCLMQAAFPDEYPKLSLLDKLYRPLFRWHEDRKYRQVLRLQEAINTPDLKSKENGSEGGS